MPFAVLAAQAFAPCDKQGGPQAPLDKSWVKINRQIYFGRQGKIYQTRFNSNQLTVLTDHGFDYLSEVTLSPDVQYIAYRGYKNKQFSSYLYDLKRGQDYRLPIDYDPPVFLPTVEFSPDSKMLAWPAINPRGDSQQVVIMNLENHTSQVRRYPLDVKSLVDYRMTTAKWSPDGKYLFFETIAFPVSAFYKYNVGTQEFVIISGKDGRFIENGNDLPYYSLPCRRWSCAEQDKPMKGESATIDDHYRLIVKSVDGHEVTVDKGAVSACGIPTISFEAWLDNGKYLVYLLDGIAYIYGVHDHRKAVLFDASGSNVFFGWANTEDGNTSD